MTDDEDGHKKFSTCLNGEGATVLEENDIEPKVTNALDLDSGFDNDILQSSQEWLQEVEVDLNLDPDGHLCVRERKINQTAPTEKRIGSALTQVSDNELDFSLEVDQDERYGVASAVIRALHQGLGRSSTTSGWSSGGETSESSSKSESSH